MGSSSRLGCRKATRVMVKVWNLLLIAGCFGFIRAQDVETRSAPVESEENGNHAEIQQMINMMKNYKNRLFLANHGKRSVVEPMEGVEDFEDEDIDDMAEFKVSPNSFFFLPMPIGRSYNKRGGLALPRPNGFMFPVGRRASYGMSKRSAGQKMLRNPNGFNFPVGKRYLINPNGFNFPMPKRSAPELDLDGNFFGQRGKRRLQYIHKYFNKYN